MKTPTNPQAPVRCSRTIVIQAPAPHVWVILTDINHWAAWQTDITQPALNGQLQPAATFGWKTGGAKIQSILHTVQPNRYFGWTGKTFGLYAIHNWTLTEGKGTTQVSVDESMEGFLATIFKKSFNKNLEKGMDRWLQLLKAECEK
ncbi:MAG: SRPBCC family protein [Ferruginibacter sp.]|nr:SRPBCC family protein [Cytophagales bacterium]